MRKDKLENLRKLNLWLSKREKENDSKVKKSVK